MSEGQDNPRKRPRVEEEGENNEGKENEEPAGRVHEEYNYTDGGIVTIRVENTLFKIHRYLLTRDSVVFKDMFEVGQGQGNKIIDLPDTPLDHFTALCWALYASLKDASDQFPSTANVQRLISLTEMANKYQFIALEEWATTVLTHHCRAHNRLGKCSFDEVASFLKLTSLCSSSKFQSAVEDGILARLEKDGANVPWTQVLPTFELCGRRSFRGMVYYHLLQATERTGTQAQPSTTAPKTAISLDQEQLRSIQTGYWSLTKFLENRFVDPLPVAQGTTCAAHTICQKHWTDIVKNMEKSSRSRVDVLGRLNKLQRTLQKITPLTACISAVIARLETEQKGIVDTMADHFFGVVPVGSAAGAGNGDGPAP